MTGRAKSPAPVAREVAHAKRRAYRLARGAADAIDALAEAGADYLDPFGEAGNERLDVLAYGPARSDLKT